MLNADEQLLSNRTIENTIENTVENTIENTIDVNINIKIDGASEVKVTDSKNEPVNASDEAQLSSQDQELKNVDSQLNNNNVEQLGLDQSDIDNKNNLKDKDNKIKDLNESILSSGTNKSHSKSIKKVTFDFKSDMNQNPDSIKEIEETNALESNNINGNESSKPSNEANIASPNPESNTELNGNSKFNNVHESIDLNGNNKHEDELQIREDFDEDLESPTKHKVDSDNEFGESIFEISADPSKFQTMDST